LFKAQQQRATWPLYALPVIFKLSFLSVTFVCFLTTYIQRPIVLCFGIGFLWQKEMSANKKSGAKTSAFNGIAVANSMFACLPCDEEAEIKKKNRGVKKREQEDKPQPKKNDNNSAQQKNKNKNSLQSAAVLSNKSKKKSQTPQPQPPPPQSPPASSPPGHVPPVDPAADNPDWTRWQERDQETVDAEYEKDLQEAIELSKKEAKEMEAVRRAIAEADVSTPSSASSSSAVKKKKKKNNSETKVEKTVHLSTFLSQTPDHPTTSVVNGAAAERLGPSNDEEMGDTLLISPQLATLTAQPKTYEVDAEDTAIITNETDDDFLLATRSKGAAAKERDLRQEKEAEERAFLRQIQQDVNKIIRKEECTEFIKQNEQLISDAVRCAQYRDEIDQKEVTIKELQQEIETIKDEFAKVKKRNKQLAFIISQGEMQEKADLLTEIDELKEVKDELTSQTAQLQQELEQERTKTHKMAKELQALKGHKGGKHSSPSASEN